MDRNRFDEIVRLFAAKRSRRAAIAALLSAALLGQTPGIFAKAGKKKRRDKDRGKGNAPRRGRANARENGSGQDAAGDEAAADAPSSDGSGTGDEVSADQRHGGRRQQGNGRGQGRGKGKHRGKGKGKNRKQKQPPARQAQAEAACYNGSPCIPGPGKNLGRCNFSGSSALKGKNLKGANLGGATVARGDASGANLQGANLDKTCLVDAILTGAIINGSTNIGSAILCRTTMPDGSVSNAGCNKGTPCCPTCDAAHPCPNGQVCCQGRCRTGDCCSDSQCPDPAKPICLNNRCSPCTSHQQCGTGKRCCDGQCKSGNCCTAGDCADRACQSKSCPTNQCAYEPASGAACDDGDPCTVGDTCQNGTCATTPKDCSAEGDECNDGVCRASDGACVKRPKQDGTGCNADNDSCTVGDSCQNGVCTPGAGVSCGHLDDACNRGVCQPDGSCTREPRNNDELCLAGANVCTDVGACRDGACVAGPPVVCTAADECHVAGVCDPETGRCSNPTAPNGTTCGNNGRCDNGRCVEPCLPVRAVCDPATDTCCDSEGEFCSEAAACRDGGEPGRCCRPEGAFCEQSCDCCGGVCAGGVCCVPNQQCNTGNDCCDGQECIDNVCASVCGTDRALCGGGMGTAPCCDGYRCFNGECWPGTCPATTEECSSASECCPDGVITCEPTYDSNAPVCCHPYNQTCQHTDECCDIRVCGPESKCCIGGPFDPDRPQPFGTNVGVCLNREHECCPGRRCHPLSKFCCVDEGQPVPQNEAGFVECCHFAEQDGVCTCRRKGEACAAPGGNPFLSNCCDGLFCFNGICNTLGCNGFGCFPSAPCCIGCTFDENTGCCDCPRP